MVLIKQSTVFAAIFLGLCVGSARAQGVVTVKVPFAFIVDQQEFPAGEYDIRIVEGGGTVLAIEGVKNRSAALVFTSPARGGDPAGDEPSLVFTRSENHYQLSQIWESRTVGRELARPAETGQR